MDRHRTAGIGLVLLMMATPCASSGQAGPAAAVGRLSPGDMVRVQAPGISVDGGAVSEIDGETLYVLEGGQEWLVDIAAIERLERRHRTVGKNVLIFGGIGALAGFAAGKFNEDLSIWPFAVGGVAVGVAFGLSNREWRVIYPR